MEDHILKLQRINAAKRNTKRRTIWRHIERRLSWIIRGGRWKVSGKCAYAPCDSLIFAGGPWLCYCCQRLRERIAGVRLPRPGRRARVGSLMLAFYMWRYVHTRHGTYVWPDTKYIYP